MSNLEWRFDAPGMGPQIGPREVLKLGQQPAKPSCELMDQVIGYLNFSTGAVDHRFQANLDQLFASCEEFDKSYQEVCSKRLERSRGFSNGCVSPEFQAFADRMKNDLLARVDHLQSTNPSTYSDVSQSQAVIKLVFGKTAWRLPAMPC